MQSADQLFDARIVPVGALAVLRCSGELCMYTAGRLVEAGEELGHRSEEIRLLDLQRVSFVDGAGLRAVVTVLRTVGRDRAMPSVATSRSLRMVSELLGVPIRARVVPGWVLATAPWPEAALNRHRLVSVP